MIYHNIVCLFVIREYLRNIYGNILKIVQIIALEMRARKKYIVASIDFTIEITIEQKFPSRRK